MIVIGRKYGQLGNRLLLFAHWIAFSLEHDQALCNPAFEDYAQFFAGTRKNLLSRYPSSHHGLGGHWMQRGAYAVVLAARKAHVVGRVVPLIDCPDGEHYRLDTPEAVGAVTRHDVVFVTGFGFRCEELVRAHADKIRSYFTPAEPWATRIAEVRRKARANVDVLIGVHIRRGDFRQFFGGRWFYEDSTYLRLMREAATPFKGRRVAFLVVSNEPVNVSGFEDADIRQGTGHLVEDMYALASCDYLIAPPSTFASWASFYGRVPICQVMSSDDEVKPDAFHVHDCPVP